MTLHDELARGHPACKVCLFLDGLHGGDRTRWETALARPTDAVPHSKVVTALRVRGVSIDEASVRRHRRNHAG